MISSSFRATETKLANIKLAEVIPVAPAHLVSREPMERRVERMRAQLAKGGEIAQGVLRDLFPTGFWLYADPNGKRQRTRRRVYRRSGRATLTPTATCWEVLAARVQRRR